jgi:hypothetical protein
MNFKRPKDSLNISYFEPLIPDIISFDFHYLHKMANGDGYIAPNWPNPHGPHDARVIIYGYVSKVPELRNNY